MKLRVELKNKKQGLICWHLFLVAVCCCCLLLNGKMGFGFNLLSEQKAELKMSKNPFLLHPQFYKNLFAASAILQKPGAAQNECNKLFNAQTFPRNLLFSCGDDKEVD